MKRVVDDVRVFNNRYRILHEEGRDEDGILFLAEDLIHSRQVHLKLIDMNLNNSAIIEWLTEYFFEIRSVRHRNLLWVDDFDLLRTINRTHYERKQYYYTYELLEDVEPVSYLSLSRNDAITVIEDLFKVFLYLDFRGTLYQYLTFDNILIYRQHGRLRLKLSDLVSVRLYANNNLHSNVEINQFIAPELLWSRRRTYKNDIYSLSVVVFYLYYRYDYLDNRLSEYIQTIKGTSLHELIRRAMSQISQVQYVRVKTFVKDLTEALYIDLAFDDAQDYHVIQKDLDLVGRRKELDRLQEAIDDELKLVGVYGEPGVGKTRLLSELARLHGLKGQTPLVFEGTAAGSLARYLVEETLGQGHLNSQLITRYGPELVKIVPEIKEKWNVDPSEPLDESHEMHRLANRVSTFLAGVYHHEGQLLIIDDLEELSPLDRRVLRHLVRLKDHKITVIFSAVEPHLDLVPTCDESTSLNLYRFNLDEAGLFTKGVFGISRIPYNTAGRFMVETGGNPGRMLSLIERLVAEERIYLSEDRIWFTDEADSMTEFVIDQRKEKRYRDVLKVFSEEEQRFASLISVFFNPVNIETLMRYIGDEVGDADRHLEQMMSLNLLTSKLSDVEILYAFTNERIRQICYDRLNVEEQWHLNHRAALAYMADVVSRFSPESIVAIAEHLDRSGDQRTLASYLEQVVARYVDRHQHERTIPHLRRLAGLYRSMGDEMQASETTYRLVETYLSLNRLAEAEEANEELLVSLVDRQTKLHAHSKLVAAKIYIRRDAFDEARMIIEPVMKTFSDNLPIQLEAEALLARLAYYEGKNEEQLQRAINGLEQSIACQETYFTARFHNELGIYHVNSGDVNESLAHFQMASQLFESIGEIQERVKTINNTGVVQMTQLGHILEGREAFEEVLTIQHENNFHDGRPIYLLNLGESYFLEGQYDRALTIYQEVMDEMEGSDDVEGTINAYLRIAEIYMPMNAYDQAFAILDKLEREHAHYLGRTLEKLDFYLLNIEYNYRLNHIERMAYWISRFTGESEKAPAPLALKFAAFRYLLTHKKTNAFGHSVKVDYAGLESLEERAQSPLDIRILRYVIGELFFDILQTDQYMDLDRLLRIDAHFVHQFDSSRMRWRRQLAEAKLTDRRVEKLEALLVNPTAEREWRWRAYKLLGDEYRDRRAFFDALGSYMKAMTILRENALRINDVQLGSYLLHDVAKVELKRSIVLLGNVERSDIETIAIDETADFFHFPSMGRRFRDEEFRQSVAEHYQPVITEPLFDERALIGSFSTDVTENLRHILEHMMVLTLAEEAKLYLHDVQRNTATLLLSLCLEESGETIDHYLLNNMIDEDLLLNELSFDARYYQKEKRAVMILPILEDLPEPGEENRRYVETRRPVGYCFLRTSSSLNRFTEEVLERFRPLKAMLHNLVINHNLMTLSGIDDLTGAFNRRQIERHFEDALLLAERQHAPLSVAMVDIDHFKQINDTHGHQRGDEILRALGGLLRDPLRRTDFVGRYGGEEFLILLPGSDVEEAVAVADKLRIHVQEASLMGGHQPLTVSIGLATYPKDGLTVHQLIDRADKGLYVSKNRGRNTLTHWQEMEPKDFDRINPLTGILTGEIYQDTNNVASMVKILSLFDREDEQERLHEIFIQLLEIVEGNQVSYHDGQQVFTHERGGDVRLAGEGERRKTIELIENYGSGYFINWDAPIDPILEMPAWRSYIVLPLDGAPGRALVLEASIQTKEFEEKDYHFVGTLKGVLGKLLDTGDKEVMRDVSDN